MLRQFEFLSSRLLSIKQHFLSPGSKSKLRGRSSYDLSVCDTIVLAVCYLSSISHPTVEVSQFIVCPKYLRCNILSVIILRLGVKTGLCRGSSDLFTDYRGEGYTYPVIYTCILPLHLQHYDRAGAQDIMVSFL